MANILRIVLTSMLFSSIWLEITLGKTCDYHLQPARNEFDKTIYRLGKTRYFIHFSKDSDDGKKHWSQWQSERYSWFHLRARLAVLMDKISTNAIIARNLERTVTKNNITCYTYWIGARNTGSMHGDYHWVTTRYENKGPSLRYTNIFYKAPRIIGASGKGRGGHLVNDSTENDIDDVHELDRDKYIDTCIAFSMPFKNNPTLGHQTSWVQRECNQATSGLLELVPERFPECDENNQNLHPQVLTEDKEYYYTEGNWIFANRRFIVNWKPRNSWEAEEYCRLINLDVFAPTIDDICLIPYLKMWGMALSTYQFWTQYMYDPKEKVFMTQNGTVVQRGAKVPHSYLESRKYVNGKHIYNVSYIWTYEMQNETRCKDINCKWSYYVLAPIYEQMYLGTICQHKKKDNTRPCDFLAEWNHDFTKALPETSVVEFGYKGSGYWRSAYKQTFGSRICGKEDRQMAGVESEYWNVNVTEVEFIYDYLETYWVVDEGLFQHVGKHEPLCTVSTVTNEANKFQRKTEKRNCDEWHFYLCESVY